MKFFYRLLFLPIFILAFTGCGKDEVEDDEREDNETTDVTSYNSQDMKTDDGKVTQLQKHKIGKGVPIVIMGDGFVDKDIKEGRYRYATSKALDAIFSRHPLKSLRDYFDVYEVTAVSKNDFMTFWTHTDDPSFSTAFSVGVSKENSDGSIVSELTPGDAEKVKEYAKKAIDGNRIDDATIIVIVNDFPTEGVTTYSSYTAESREVPTGCGTAYVNLMEFWDKSIDVGDFSKVFTNVVLHEFGHAFAKLADEYIDKDRQWSDPKSAKNDFTLQQRTGYNRNVSIYSDVTKTYWADFAADSRYDFEKLGCYEGGYYQEKGVYRPTENNIMSNLNFGFDVVGRAMIYKRCMKIAYGDSWEFNYEDFVKFDLEKAKAEHEELRKQYPDYSKSMRSCAPPRFVDCVSRLKDVKTRK